MLKKKEDENKEKNPEESWTLKMAKTEVSLKLKMAKYDLIFNEAPMTETLNG